MRKGEKMKKVYEEATIELVEFAIEDIIATSDSYEGPLKPLIPGGGDLDDDLDDLSDFSGEPLPETPEPDMQTDAEPETDAQVETEPETEAPVEDIPEEPIVQE